MKKVLFSVVALLAAFTLQSCGDEIYSNNPSDNREPAEQISGIYQGKLFISRNTPLFDETTLLYSTDTEGNPVLDDQGEKIPAQYNVTLEADGDESVTFRLYNFVFNRLNLGNLTLHYIPILKDASTGVTAFLPNQPVRLALGAETVGDARAVKAEVSIDDTTSKIENGQAVIDIVLKWYKNGFDDDSNVETVYLRYEGEVTEEPVSPEPPVFPGDGPVSEQAAGVYQGQLNVSLAGPVYDEATLIYKTDANGDPVVDAQGNPVPETFNVNLDADSETSVTFSLNNFGFMGMSLGDIVLHNVPLSRDKTTGRIVFGENQPVQLTLGEATLGADNAIKATAKIDETSSYIENGHAFIDVEVVWYMVGFEDTETVQPIYVRYQGDIAENLAEQIAGTYQGKLNVSLDGAVYDESTTVYEVDENGDPVVDAEGNPVPGKYNVTLAADGAVSVTFGLYDFGFMGMSLGNIVLHDIPLVKDTASGRITFGSNPPVRLTLGAESLGEDNAIKATAKIKESTSYIENGHAFIDVEVVWYMVGFEDTETVQPIYVRYQGDIQTTPAPSALR